MLVGRAAELATIRGALARLVGDRSNSLILLEGAAGFGKTALFDRVVADARAAGAAPLVGAADEIETRTPYHALRGVIAGTLGLDPLASREAMRRQALGRLASYPELERAAPLLNVALPLELEETDWTRRLPPDARAETLRTLILRLLREQAAAQPIVLAVDDAHWIDPASWTLLQLAAQHVRPMMIVLAARPISVRPDALTAIARTIDLHEIDLGALPSAEAEAMVAQGLGAGALAPDVAAFIREHADGHPFFSLEIARGLREAGAITVANGTCTAVAGRLEGFPVPANVRAAVNMRVDGLSATAQLALRVASVFGGTFSFTALGEVYPVAAAPGELHTALGELIQREFVAPERASSSGAFRFSHAIAREVAYDALVFAQRRELHAAVAGWYETAHAKDLSEVYERLGHHWRHAEQGRRAAGFFGMAGERALSGYNNEAAVRFLTDALELESMRASAAPTTTSAPRAVAPAPLVEPRRWHLLAGRACANWARYGDARGHLERGLRLSGETVHRGVAGAVAGVAAQVARQVAHRRWPGRFVGSRARQRVELGDVIGAFESLTETYYVEGAMFHCLHAALRYLNLAELANDHGHMARGYASVGAILGFIPMPAAAQRYCERALKTVESGADPAAVPWVLLAVGVYQAGLGRWDDAESLLSRGASVAAAQGDRRRWEDCTHHLAAVSHFRGRFDDALARTHELAASATGAEDGSRASRGFEVHATRHAVALRIRAHTLLALGRTDEAAAVVAALETLTREPIGIAERERLLMLNAVIPLVLLRRGDPQGALEAAAPAFAQLAKPSTRGYDVLLEYAALAEICRAAGEARPGSARKEARLAARALRAHARVFPIARPVAESLSARA
jgi:hypothetical protein